VRVKGELTETTIALPAMPTKVTLNPLESVLADVKVLEWEP